MRVLGVISKVRTSRTNERTFIWHFTPSLPPQTKVWSTMREMYGWWLLYAHYPRSSQQPTQTMSSVSRRDASLEVQRPLWNEQGDNLEQSKKNTTSTFLSISARSKVAWAAGVDECRTEADARHALPFNWRLQPGLQKPIDDISDGSPPPAFFCLDLFEIAQWLATLYWRFALICKRRSAIGRRSRFFFSFFFFLYCRSHKESGPNPLPPIWKFFRLSALCELLRWPLSINFIAVGKSVFFFLKKKSLLAKWPIFFSISLFSSTCSCGEVKEIEVFMFKIPDFSLAPCLLAGLDFVSGWKDLNPRTLVSGDLHHFCMTVGCAAHCAGATLNKIPLPLPLHSTSHR